MTKTELTCRPIDSKGRIKRLFLAYVRMVRQMNLSYAPRVFETVRASGVRDAALLVLEVCTLAVERGAQAVLIDAVLDGAESD